MICRYCENLRLALAAGRANRHLLPQVSMCKMCGTKHRKTFELLTDLSPAAWPYDDKSDCQPSRPCKSLMEAIQAGKNRRHPVRLEWDASTESATYLPGFNKELTRAIFMHHNIPLPRARK